MSFKFFISILIIYYIKIREINSLNYHTDSRIRSHIIIFFYYYNMIFRLIFMVVFGIISCALKITIGRRGRGGGDCTLLVLVIWLVACLSMEVYMSFKFFISILIIYYIKIREINSLNYHTDSRIRSHIIIFFYYYNMIFRLIFMVVFGIISCALKITIGRRGRGGGDCTLLVLDLIFVVSCNRISSSLLFSKEFNNYIIHNNRRFEYLSL